MTGQALHITGVFDGSVTLHDSSISYFHRFVVCDNMLSPLQCILGWDFIQANRLQLVIDRGIYYLSGPHGNLPLTPVYENSKGSSETLFQSSTLGPVPVKLTSAIVVPPMSELVIKCSISRSSKNLLGMITSSCDQSSLPTVHVAHVVCSANNRVVPVRLLNNHTKEVELQAGQKIAEFCPLVGQGVELGTSSCSAATFSNGDKSCEELAAAISSSLLPEQKASILDVLYRYSEVFEDTLGHSSVVTHSIDTGNAAPIRQHPRRLPFAYREDAQQQIADMLKQGVIKPSTSAWASPIVMVKKKDGSFRFCIDYRRLNSVTQRDARPLPRVDDLLDSLQGYKYFSTLDLRSGYWQLDVNPKDRHKTAFVTPQGLWEFVRLPFGLCGAPSTFDRAMKIIMSGLNYESCLCYFDDIIIPSIDINQHCERLGLVLERLQKANLRVKASKCLFGADKVVYLGHTVSARGIHTEPSKIEAVKKMCPPNNVEQVRSFLGLAGYYRKFIPNFATIAAPLTSLTKKGCKFQWLTVHQRSFDLLKRQLCNAPILVYPQLDAPFILQTDASNVGLGAVLTQKDSSGDERVIAYASRTLTERERNYSVLEKEALAVVFATQHFRVYLLGQKFKLVTDNNALTWLHKIEPKGRIARWIMGLQEFEFEISHRPGRENANADALSRLVDTADRHSVEEMSDKYTTCFVKLTPELNLHQAQLKDPDIAIVVALKEQRLPKPPLFVWKKNEILRTLWYCWDELFLSDGLLVRAISTGQKVPRRVFVVPQSVVGQILHSLHSGPSGGHMGITRTLYRIKQRFFWPKMQECVKNYITSCSECMQSKLLPNQGKAPLTPILVSEPFVFWAIDYMGPLPETSRGNKHLLVVGDHFTKWCEAFATKDQKAQTVARLLVSKLFSRFGPPDILHSDQGQNFESNLMHEICQIMGIKKSRTTAYHPQGDGQVERQNRTLQEILSSFVGEHPENWDLYVDQAVYAYNTSRHETTGYSPYELVFGREPRMPIEVDLGVPLQNPRSHSEYAREVRQAIRNSTEIAQKNLYAAKKRQALYADRKSKEWKPFELGSYVWLRRPKKWKFGRKWVGPYKVLVKMGVNYKVESQHGKVMVVHHNQLKPCPLSFNDEGKDICPVSETAECEIVEQATNDDMDENPGEIRNQVYARPPRLRQVVNLPLRYGDYVSH